MYAKQLVRNMQQRVNQAMINLELSIRNSLLRPTTTPPLRINPKSALLICKLIENELQQQGNIFRRNTLAFIFCLGRLIQKRNIMRP